MKNKYQRLSKEEQKQVRSNYIKTEKGKKQSFYLKRLRITAILCIIVGLIILGINLVTNVKWYEYIVVGALLLSGIVFLYASYKIGIKSYNNSIIKK